MKSLAPFSFLLFLPFYCCADLSDLRAPPTSPSPPAPSSPAKTPRSFRHCWRHHHRRPDRLSTIPPRTPTSSPTPTAPRPCIKSPASPSTALPPASASTSATKTQLHSRRHRSHRRHHLGFPPPPVASPKPHPKASLPATTFPSSASPSPPPRSISRSSAPTQSRLKRNCG
jgi:hypothetical protein